MHHYVVYYTPRTPFCQDVLPNNMLQKTQDDFMDSDVFLLFSQKVLTKRTECASRTITMENNQKMENIKTTKVH